MNFSSLSRGICLLGSTGSIGRNTLEVVRNHRDKFQIKALAAGNNLGLLKKQITEFRPLAVCIESRDMARQLEGENLPCRVHAGEEGLMKLVALPQVDTVVSAITGTISIGPTLEALNRGLRVCLANKETLVAAGGLIRGALKASDGCVVPVDSEHSAIHQCLHRSRSPESLHRIVLTASGGPFFQTPPSELQNITVADALNHPTWNMGRKISIDSATMMNKALEMIEAHYLFGISGRRIEVLIHPQSIVHSLVEFVDTSVLAQMGLPDMKLPILYSLTWPERIPSGFSTLNLAEVGKLEFFHPDEKCFPSLVLARYVLEQGGNTGAVFNAANEVAVEAFLDEKIRFTDIAGVVGKILYSTKVTDVHDLGEVKKQIKETKARTNALISEEYHPCY